MIKRSLSEIIKMIQVQNDLTPFLDVVIDGVSIDSRKIEKGNLFIPFKGEHSDGHRFVEEAIKKGAAAALWQKDVPNPPVHLPIIIVEDTLSAIQELARSYRNQLNIKVVGITGSNGKTSTKDMIAGILSLKYKVKKTEGNYNNHLGLPLTVLGLEEDTEIAVLEMGMSGLGEIEFLTKLACPDVVVITNIGESHLQDLGSREGIAKAKLEIIQGLKEGGRIIYYGDEPLLTKPLSKLVGVMELKTFGKSNKNDIYPLDIAQSEKGSKFRINLSNVEYSLPILGTHNILNSLAAMLAADFFNISYEEMRTGLLNLKLTSMRMEIVEGLMGQKIINDAYNASPTSMKAAIELVTELPGYNRKILVLGDMLELGSNEEVFHYEIGQSINADKIDYVFTFGKLGLKIAEGADSVLSPERVFSFVEKNALVEKLLKYTDQNSLILVKASRGMKLEEIVNALVTKNK